MQTSLNLVIIRMKRHYNLQADIRDVRRLLEKLMEKILNQQLFYFQIKSFIFRSKVCMISMVKSNRIYLA